MLLKYFEQKIIQNVVFIQQTINDMAKLYFRNYVQVLFSGLFEEDAALLAGSVPSEGRNVFLC